MTPKPLMPCAFDSRPLRITLFPEHPQTILIYVPEGQTLWLPALPTPFDLDVVCDVLDDHDVPHNTREGDRNRWWRNLQQNELEEKSILGQQQRENEAARHVQIHLSPTATTFEKQRSEVVLIKHKVDDEIRQLKLQIKRAKASTTTPNVYERLDVLRKREHLADLQTTSLALQRKLGEMKKQQHQLLVFANESSAQFVEMILPLISDARMVASKFQTRFVSILGSFLLAGKLSREPFLLSCPSFVVSRISDLLTSAQRDERGDADIQSDCGLQSWQRSNACILTEQRNVPAASSVEVNRDRGRFDVRRKKPAPSNGERFVHLGEGQRMGLSVPTESAPGERCTAAAPFAFEAGIGRALLEEVCIGCLEMAKGLLKWDTGHFIEEGKLGPCLPLRERSALGRVSDRLLAVRPCVTTFSESLVVDKACTADRSAEQHLLIRRRVDAEVKASQHHSETYSRRVRQSCGGGLLPALNGGVSALEFQ